jgi:hypothetical protein
MENQSKSCLQCNRVIRGRFDKKFCDDTCRNTYHLAKHRALETPVVKNINSTLKHNRNILLTIAPAQKNYIVIKAIELIRMGYNFHYHTHYTQLGKNTLVCCFDVGFIELKNHVLIILRTGRLQENKKMD